MIDEILVILIIMIIIYINMHSSKDENEYFNNIGDKKYNVAVMTIFKNEHPYMKEWLNHHISQGVDQLYLYCNDPNIDNYPYLTDKKYEKYITLIDWVNKKNIKKNTVQKQAYSDCVTNYSNDCQFLIMIDLDEFIVPVKKNITLSSFIKNIKNSWDKTKALKFQRYNFGSNYHMKKPRGSVMNNYTMREKICSSYKTMANTDYINKKSDFYGVHDFIFLKKNGKIYNKYFEYISGYPAECNKNNINEMPFVINHYYTKSYEEYINRCELWKDGGINPIGYRHNCKQKFLDSDVSHSNSYDIIPNI